jgi:rhodanese-related sulfurtransferase
MPRSISALELADRLRRGEAIYLLDVRDREEHAYAQIPATSLLIPLRDLPARRGEIQAPPGAALVVYCHLGVRSWTAANYLEAAGFADVLSLAGGIDAWSRQVDRSVPRYRGNVLGRLPHPAGPQ